MLANASGEPSQEELGDLAELSTKTVTNVAKALRSAGVLNAAGRGEPLKFGMGAGVTLGISAGSQSVYGALVDANGTLHCTATIDPLPDQLRGARTTLLDRIRAVAGRVLRTAFDEHSCLAEPGVLRLHGVAAAWPSLLDRQKVIQGWTMGDKSWTARDEATGTRPTVPEWLSGALGGPFTADRCSALRDASAHSLCLAFEDAQERTASSKLGGDWRVSLLIRLGQGLGASPILLAPPAKNRMCFIDSKLIEGTSGFAGSLGHLRVEKRVIEEINKDPVKGLGRVDYDGLLCSCGKHHHLQAFVSVPGVLARLQASDYEMPNDNQSRARLLAEVRDGRATDAVPVHAGLDVGRILGQALAGPVLLLDPSTITISGPLAGKPVVNGIVRERGVWGSTVADSVEVGLAESPAGDFIGVKGAALAAIRRVVYREFLDEGKTDVPASFAVRESDVANLLAPETIAPATAI
jgi:predicted NBD/HSP70 family sugar kinase